MIDQQDRFEFVKLPPVAQLETEPRQRVIALLESLDLVVREKEKLLDKEDDIKNELQRLQRETERPGFRHGLLCFVSQPVAGRKTLDKGMLLENGCEAVIIAKSYKTGAPSTRNTFKRLQVGAGDA